MIHLSLNVFKPSVRFIVVIGLMLKGERKKFSNT